MNRLEYDIITALYAQDYIKKRPHLKIYICVRKACYIGNIMNILTYKLEIEGNNKILVYKTCEVLLLVDSVLL